MATVRKPFQGVRNVVRFNWHFYLLAIAFLLFILLLGFYVESLRVFFLVLFFAALITTSITLLVTYYVYDLSDLYRLNWLEDSDLKEKIHVANINAGFDETSELLADKFKAAELTIFDFYDPLRHTEISIKRARKTYPPYPNTQQTATSKLSLGDDSADKIFAILSVHEIRDSRERKIFFKELHRILKPDGRIFVTEHLRDAANFMAYNIGFFHFHSRRSWLDSFQAAQLEIEKEIKITPFLTTFVLKKL